MILLLVTAPPGAFAQTSTTTTTTTYAVNQPTLVYSNTANTKVAFNQDACQNGGNFTVTYTFPASFTTGTTLTIFGTSEGSCPSTAPDGNMIFLQTTTITTNNQSESVTLDDITLEPSCPANQPDSNFLICAVTYAETAASTTTATTLSEAYTTSLTVTYKSLPPVAPVISAGSVTGGDGKVNLSWNTQSEIDHWIVYYQPNGPAPSAQAQAICSSPTSSSGSPLTCDSTDANCIPDDAAMPLDAAAPFDATPFDSTGFQSMTVTDGTISSATVTGLVNDQQYAFVVVAVDIAGNDSSGSAPVNGTPMVVQDFYRRYRCEGGTDTGGFGCSTAGAVLVPIAALAALALVRRRRVA
jgi:MYXO-CTERM domain-containing protein